MGSIVSAEMWENELIAAPAIITSIKDILNLHIIDFGRLNGCWENELDAMETIGSWFINKAVVTQMKIKDFHHSPPCDKPFSWQHIGGHVSIGKRYRDWFDWVHPEEELNFGDSPDFWGRIGDQMFWGDIGKVSASTFALTQKGMGAHDLWISLLGDGSHQVIIETQYSICEAVSAQFFGKLGTSGGKQ